MALGSKDREALALHLHSPENLRYIRGQLKLGKKVLIPDQRDNFQEIKWWLKSMLLILADDEGVAEAAAMIASSKSDGKPVEVPISMPPPLDVEAMKAAIKKESAHSALIDGIYVQLDIDQNKHQPASVPIGTRMINGEKFGTYATKAWHQSHTMTYMANWAKGLGKQDEGRKDYHGQSKRVPIDGVGADVCFEGFCVTLGGLKHVSFHCYPNSY